MRVFTTYPVDGVAEHGLVSLALFKILIATGINSDYLYRRTGLSKTDCRGLFVLRMCFKLE